ncbi:MAG: hypothetical protein H5T84_10135, partial [Thermoleophilia bacterium]|nr:hypothetical protein [Thermoleophilia bacterium]
MTGPRAPEFVPGVLHTAGSSPVHCSPGSCRRRILSAAFGISRRLGADGMGMTITEKILARASGKDQVAPGDLIMARVD